VKSSNFALSNIEVEIEEARRRELAPRANPRAAFAALSVPRKQSEAPASPSNPPPHPNVFIVGLAIPLHKLFCFERFETTAPGGCHSRARGSFTVKLKTEPKGPAER